MRTYEQDYAGWVEDTAQAIEEGRFEEVDRMALADEVRDLGKSERDRIISVFCILTMHLLKVKYQPEKRTRSWDASIGVQRENLVEYFAESPSLRPRAPELLAKAYRQARIDAANQTGLDIDTFPETCEWTVQEVLG